MPEMDYSKASPFSIREGDYINSVADTNPNTAGEATIGRMEIANATNAMTSGTIRLTYFTARKSEAISQVSLIVGGTAAAATPTLVRVGIYSVNASTGELTLVASTPNDTTLLASPSTAYTKALSLPFNKVSGQRYAVGILVITAVATPTFNGSATLTGAITSTPPRLSASLAGQTDLVTPIADASLSNGFNSVYSLLLP